MHTRYGPSLDPAQPVPAVLVGGSVIGLSVARSLKRRAIPVYSINHAEEHLCHSRSCTWIPDTETGVTDAEWTAYLLGKRSEWLRGSVLLACNDAGVEMIANNRERLAEKFLLDESDPVAQLRMLDKHETYRAATRAKVPTPKYWVARTHDELLSLESAVAYPVIVKPLLSHLYREKFGRKLTFAANFDELSHCVREAQRAGLEVMVVETIPGADSRLCSYFTYLDENGRSLFDFTKRVIRRYPVTRGLGCYHVVDHVPQLRELAMRLFGEVQLRGLANVEFKFDERDGEYKLIECNARFTASTGLLADAGCDLAQLVYDRIIGNPSAPIQPSGQGKRLWYPVEDFLAFRELRRRGALSLTEWLHSIAHPTTLPYFRWSDPMPTLFVEGRRLRDTALRRLRGRVSLPSKRIAGLSR